MKIVGKNAYLRPLEMSDLERCLSWIQDAEVTQYLLMGRHPINRDREAEWLANLYKSRDSAEFAICTRADEHVGNCGLHKIDLVDRCAEAGIVLGRKDMWGRGLGTEAMGLLLRHAFESLDLQRVELEVFAFNTRAIRSYQKLGFVEEGRLRQRRYKNGKRVDGVIMSVLRSEWDARQGAGPVVP